MRPSVDCADPLRFFYEFGRIPQLWASGADTGIEIMGDSILSMRLVRGESCHNSFCLNASIPRAIFRVGSAMECNWRISAAGVRPHHLMLLWNGRCLTVIDVGAGDLWVDNQAFHLTAIVNHGQISFGGAIISIEQDIRLSPALRGPQVDTLVSPPLFGNDSESQ